MAKLQLKSKEDIRLAIRKRGREIAEQMSDAEFFGSEQFASYATRLIDFILRKHKLYSLELRHEPDNEGFTAYTDGKMIAVNTGNSQVRTPKLLERRFKVAMGAAFHEAAHKLFLDFDLDVKAKKSICAGKLYGKFPTNGDPDLEKALQELTDVVASPYAQAVASIYANLANFIYDGHDEAAMKRCFPGFISECITVKNEVQLELTPSLEQMIAERTETLGIRMALLLEYAKYGGYKCIDPTGYEAEVEEHLQAANALEPTIDSALQTDNAKERWEWLNLLVLQLWPSLRELFPKNPQNNSGSNSGSQDSSQGGSGGSGSAGGGGGQSSQGEDENDPSQGAPGGGGSNSEEEQDESESDPSGQPDPTPEEVEQAINNLAKEIEQALQQAPAPVNNKGKAVDPSAIQNALQSPGSGSDADTLANQIAQGAATQQVQQELDQAQMEAIRNTNLPLVHKHVDFNTIRHNRTDEKEYKKILKKITPYLRNLVKDMKDLLAELNEESVEHHRRFGPIVEATETYRVDNTYFAKKKLPEDLPNMAICVLIDQSGSMGGTKLECAKKTAILLEQFASEIEIPVMVAGHDVGWDGVNLRIFTDYLSAVSNSDRYSLAGITAGGCNRDGLPIRICADMLAKRTEDVRLMVVISDGAPNDGGYCGEAAMQDISEAVKEYRRKGLLIYGAAIDDDRAVIESIYGKGFLSIQNLSSLPKTLVRLVRQQIV